MINLLNNNDIQTTNQTNSISNVLREMGTPKLWTQEHAHRFFEEFTQYNTWGEKVLFEIKEIKEFETFYLYIASILDCYTFLPISISATSSKNWTIAFRMDKSRADYHVGDVLFATARELDFSKIANENKKLDYVSIDIRTIEYAETEIICRVKIGNETTDKIFEQFDSFEEIVPLLITNAQNKQYEKLQELQNIHKEKELNLQAQMNEKEHAIHSEHAINVQNIKEEYEKKQKELEKSMEVLTKKVKKNTGKERQLQVEEEALKAKKKELAKMKEELEKDERQFHAYKENLSKQFAKYRLVHPLMNEKKQEIAEPVSKWAEQEDIVQAVQGALHAKCDRQYERKIIEAFISGLKTNQLIILHGPSGTGKSSLVNSFSKIIAHAKTKNVRVQSSWTDKQDLLGFLNPMEYQYIATDFLDALVDAKNNEDSLYLICLDEMNLAHVEYYFAEFLSAREEDIPTISLYSKHFQKIAMEIIKDYVTIDESGLPILQEEKCKQLTLDSERLKIQNCFDLCYRYPAEFEIPSNVRFIGTMNIDHTVKGLSPKTIDRSLVIELNHPEDEEALLNELERIKMNDLLSVHIENDLTVQAIDNETVQKITSINPLLKKLHATVNRRALNQIGAISTAVQSEHIFDVIVRGKILPRIEVVKNNENEAVFKELIHAFDITEGTKNRMYEMINEGRTISYWR